MLSVADGIIRYGDDCLNIKKLLIVRDLVLRVSIIFCCQLKGDPSVLIRQNFDFACEEFL